MKEAWFITIVSGGQTGADRAALEWAIAHGVPHGGWCPHGRLAEDGVLDSRYQLTETPDEHYSQRTEWNVRDSDGTVILSLADELTGGSRITVEFARQWGKPWLHLSRAATKSDAGEQIRHFVREHGIRVLNVAGPRASNEPDVGDFVKDTLSAAFLWSEES